MPIKFRPWIKQSAEVLQAAYDAALAAIKQQKALINKSCTEQDELIAQLPDKYFCSDYLGDTFSEDKMDEQSKKVHALFVSNIANWFARHYSVKLDRSEVCDLLIPKGPNRWDLDDMDLDRKEIREKIDAMSMEYQVKMDNLHLRYEDVLNWIFQQLDGFSFEEKALQEMKEQCKKSIARLQRFAELRTEEKPYSLLSMAAAIVTGTIVGKSSRARRPSSVD